MKYSLFVLPLLLTACAQAPGFMGDYRPPYQPIYGIPPQQPTYNPFYIDPNLAIRPPAHNGTMNCQSTMIGNILQTNCY